MRWRCRRAPRRRPMPSAKHTRSSKPRRWRIPALRPIRKRRRSRIFCWRHRTCNGMQRSRWACVARAGAPDGVVMTEDKLQTSIARGARAEALLKNELLQEAFATLERDYIEAWKISPARDTDGRERLWQAVNIVGKVRDHLVKVVNDGKLARRHLNELSTKPAPTRR